MTSNEYSQTCLVWVSFLTRMTGVQVSRTCTTCFIASYSAPFHLPEVHYQMSCTCQCKINFPDNYLFALVCKIMQNVDLYFPANLGRANARYLVHHDNSRNHRSVCLVDRLTLCLPHLLPSSLKVPRTETCGGDSVVCQASGLITIQQHSDHFSGMSFTTMWS